MSLDDYRSALRLGQKEYRTCVSRGEYPYLQVLDEILDHEDVQGELPLGLVNIPMNRLAGTRTAGRRSAFARNFMPLVEEDSEFATKWTHLCQAHLNEGIREPIQACEFMNRFYVVEGNKRVSVLKFFGAVSIPGQVTRIVPKQRDTLESRLYYEFMDFYRLTQINDIWFSKPGRFKALLSAIETENEMWSDQERREFMAAFTLFQRSFTVLGGDKLPMTAGDALLGYLKIYSYASLREGSEKQVRANLSKSWKEIAVQGEEQPVELFLAPKPATSKNLWDKLWSGKSISILKSTPMRVAFLHMKAAEDSKWVYAHELGRKHLDKALEKRVITTCQEGVLPEQAGGAIEQAVEDGAKVIFTTTPRLLPATLRAAVEYPSVKFLNCSLNMPYPSLRTYYGRMYEPKFLTGVIAGALTESGCVGYIADYPICGMTANINAFALGVRMVNPRAKICLEWSSQRSMDGIRERFAAKWVDIVSYQDLLSPRKHKEDFGLYRICGDSMELMATTCWNWGQFYERIVREILDRGWRDAESREAPKAINYWWGLSAGVVDIRYTRNLPTENRRLVEFLKDSMISGAFRPFAGKLCAQDHIVQEAGELRPEEIVGMDWLAENVVGAIPTAEELTEEAQKLIRLQGVRLEDRGQLK